MDFRNPVDTYWTVNPCSTGASWQYINLAIFLHFDFLRKKGLNASMLNIFVPCTFLLVNGQFDIW